jgi:hypothetical protein
MTVTVDTANAAYVTSGAGGLTSASVNVTVGAADTLLVVKMLMEHVTAPVDPSSITYNGSSLTKLGSASAIDAIDSTVMVYGAYYYMVNPPVGTFSLALTFASAWKYTVLAEPMTGVNTSSPFGALVWNTNNAGSNVNTISVTATGAGINDIYSGFGFLEWNNTAGTNGNMVNVVVQPTGGYSASGDYIPGTFAGLMSYAGGTVGLARIALAGAVPILAPFVTPYYSLESVDYF